MLRTRAMETRDQEVPACVLAGSEFPIPRDRVGPPRASSAVKRDDARPPGAARRPVASLTPCRALTLALTLASVVSAGAVRTREAAVHNAARDGLDRVA